MSYFVDKQTIDEVIKPGMVFPEPYEIVRPVIDGDNLEIDGKTYALHNYSHTKFWARPVNTPDKLVVADFSYRNEQEIRDIFACGSLLLDCIPDFKPINTQNTPAK